MSSLYEHSESIKTGTVLIDRVSYQVIKENPPPLLVYKYTAYHETKLIYELLFVIQEQLSSSSSSSLVEISLRFCCIPIFHENPFSYFRFLCHALTPIFSFAHLFPNVRNNHYVDTVSILPNDTQYNIRNTRLNTFVWSVVPSHWATYCFPCLLSLVDRYWPMLFIDAVCHRTR